MSTLLLRQPRALRITSTLTIKILPWLLQGILALRVRISRRLQLVSVIGLTFAQMVTGVMVVENLFALPGLGSMLVTDVGNRDLTAVQSELFLLAAFFLFLGLLVDLLHRMLDPRLKNATIGSGEVLS